MQLNVKKLYNNVIMPQYAHEGDACFDIHAYLPAQIIDAPLLIKGPTIIPTGLVFDIPAGHVLMVYSRSGHGFKHSTRLANCVGIIDSGYRGELMVKLTRDSANEFLLEVHNGDRIAQAMLVPVEQVELVEAKEVSETERGTKGIGSTGK